MEKDGIEKLADEITKTPKKKKAKKPTTADVVKDLKAKVSNLERRFKTHILVGPGYPRGRS